MLIAADITECDTGDSSARHPLQIEWPPAPAEDVDPISSGTNQLDLSFSYKYLVFIDPRANVDLISFPCVLESHAWQWVTSSIRSIHDQSIATQWVRLIVFLAHRAHFMDLSSPESSHPLIAECRAPCPVRSRWAFPVVIYRYPSPLSER